ncbi:hypothetical protein [Nocardioides xinjiangensis]|uniref:hypothetical protein n=1 Tax=Nocardioides xinjiangensis TaxID=2817376 RepID=UPI001B30BDED|nr:hypothetical protein [Nocardioides sp. SYSU D00514]
MTALIIIVVVLLVLLAAGALVVRRRNREANIQRADELRQQAASRAQATIAPAQERAAAAEAQAAQARAAAERAEAEAAEARVAAQQVEASHEGQLRAADRLDPRVDHTADDYSPQVPGTADQQPAAGQPPLPRRTPGANEMPGKPIEKTDGGGGWFTKGSDHDRS